MSAIIRPMTERDLEGVLDLWEALVANGATFDGRFTAAPGARAVFREHVRAEWTREDPFPRCLVALDGDAPVGLVAGFPIDQLPVLELEATARIGDMFVADSHRRQGIGRELVEAFVAGARLAGYPRVEVGTLAADTRAIDFWRGVGFGDWQVTLSRES